MPAPDYLSALLAPYASPPPPTRPHVTLTFAQSLDGKIAGAAGAQLALSGPESMRMTHWLRTLHDAILVGIGTALNDDPQLNTRHLPPDEPHRAPHPIVLDSRLRLPSACKLLRNHSAGAGRRPWVVAVAPSESAPDPEWQARKDALTAAGARILLLTAGGAHTPPDTHALLALLRAEGVNTLMVEGGARVISSFFNAPGCVDTLLVTTAPVLVGAAGVGWAVERPIAQVRPVFFRVPTSLPFLRVSFSAFCRSDLRDFAFCRGFSFFFSVFLFFLHIARKLLLTSTRTGRVPRSRDANCGPRQCRCVGRWPWRGMILLWVWTELIPLT
ncbi:dihydrofolate reductase-like domain-containing protein [Mycena epipterygia]|nr:dihydrofolate reductase-like domain-containing protein [Mycena epipterygia]